MLSKEILIEAFGEMDKRLAALDIKAELCVVGGAAMCLAFDARAATKDLDAIFHPSAAVRDVAKEVGEKMGLDSDWLNDAVKGYIDVEPTVQVFLFKRPNLLVWTPDASYLLAMKVLSSRVDTHDVDDVIFLAKKLNLTTAQDILAVARKIYGTRIPQRAIYMLEELEESGALKK